MLTECRGLLASAGTLNRLWAANFPVLDMVRQAVIAMSYPSYHWEPRCSSPLVFDLGIWGPMEVMWGIYGGYYNDGQHKAFIAQNFPQRQYKGPEWMRDRVLDWEPEFTREQRKYVYGLLSSYWATLKRQLLQDISGGEIDTDGTRTRSSRRESTVTTTSRPRTPC